MRNAILSFVLGILLLLTGCSGGDINIIFGYWKTEGVSPITGRVEAVSFKEGIYNIGIPVDVTYEKEGKTVIAIKKGTANRLAVITPLSKNKLIVETPGSTFTLIRIPAGAYKDLVERAYDR